MTQPPPNPNQFRYPAPDPRFMVPQALPPGFGYAPGWEGYAGLTRVPQQAGSVGSNISQKLAIDKLNNISYGKVDVYIEGCPMAIRGFFLPPPLNMAPKRAERTIFIARDTTTNTFGITAECSKRIDKALKFVDDNSKAKVARMEKAKLKYAEDPTRLENIDKSKARIAGMPKVNAELYKSTTGIKKI